jgi:nucleotide-binding universal stress UspA family protein
VGVQGVEATRVIAAIAGDGAAPAVLAGAVAIAELFAADVEALHVGGERAVIATSAARRAGVALRSLPGEGARLGSIPGEAAREIVEAAEKEDVAAVVIGARGTPAGRRPAGSTAIALITPLTKPVAVVPPDARLDGPIRRVLVPLDGDAASSAALAQIVALTTGTELQVVVAHVHSAWSLPPFSDHFPHEGWAWSEEFIARHCPSARDATVEQRIGEPSEHVLDICRRCGCDLVALGWNQDLGYGRAAVVRLMLAESPVPLLLTPVGSGVASMRGRARRSARRASSALAHSVLCSSAPKVSARILTSSASDQWAM